MENHIQGLFNPETLEKPKSGRRMTFKIYVEWRMHLLVHKSDHFWQSPMVIGLVHPGLNREKSSGPRNTACTHKKNDELLSPTHVSVKVAHQ